MERSKQLPGRTYRTLISALLVCISVMMVSSCSDGDNEYENPKAKNLISFLPMEVKTRALQTTSETLDSYGVSASIYSNTDSYNSVGWGSYFYNSKVMATDGRTEYYWPGAGYKLSFFAFTPYSNDNIAISPATKTGRPSYTVKIPSDIASQFDFMTAEVLDQSGEGTDKPVKIAFSHKLSDIKFSVNNGGNDAVTVHSVSLQGLKYNGILDGEAWTVQGEANTASENPFIWSSEKVVGANSISDISGNNGHMMVLPQTVSAGTDFISVEATVGGSRKKYIYKLPADFSLEQGKTYNFKITLNADYIDVDTDSDIQDWGIDVKYLSIDGTSIDGNMPQRPVESSNVTSAEDWVKE